MSLAANRHRSGRPSRRSDAACRAVTSAERFPAEPPETKTPPASPGNPARPATHRSASFSAQIAPAPSIHPVAIVDDAPTMRSKSTLAFVGAAGTNATDAGWSVEIVAGARTSAQIRSASSHPIPSGAIVRPARRASSSAGATRSSGWGLAIRFRAYATIARASSSVSSSYVCMRCITAASSSATR